MKKRLIPLILVLLALAACSQAQSAGVRERAPAEEETTAAVSSEPSAKEAPGSTNAMFPNAEPCFPENNMEPDAVSAGAMGDILCDETLPDGTRIVCYWEPGTEYTKYWAVHQGDTLLRFCEEESGYGCGYAVEPFSGVLGQDGFRILAPRGAAYDACDYYVLDSEGVPRLLAHCANQVEEADLDQDGETDLRWYYHGGRDVFTYFRQDGQLYLSYVDLAAESKVSAP